MKKIENQVFEFFNDRSSGMVFSDLEFTNCQFIGGGFSSIDVANLDNLDLVRLRSTARRMRFLNCRAESVGFVGPGIVEDTTIDGLRVTNHLQTTGTAFRHVIVRGVVDKFMITPYLDTFGRFPNVQMAFEEANREYYKGVDWALDISEALFKDCDIRNIPAHLVKRDPDTQVVLTREKAMSGRWRKIDLTKTYWPTAIEFFLEGGEQDCVLVAPKKARNFKTLLEGLNRLRDAGIAE